MAKQIIELELHRLTGGARIDWLKRVAAETLSLIRDLLVTEDEMERGELGRRLEELRTRIEGDEEARTLAEQVLKLCRDAVNKAMLQRQEQRKEMASLVNLVHDAVKSVGDEVTAFETTVGESTTRFEAISELDDPRLIKSRLIAEVKVLKQVAVERRKAWDANSKKFAEQVEALQQQLNFTKKEAAVDPLTGIANRRTFDQVLAEWIRRPGAQFVLAYIDVDDFKSINDTHGHMVGDQVLTAVATKLTESFRAEDLVARIGGDEFAVLVSSFTLRQAEGRFGKLITMMFAGDSTLPLTPRLSCGVAEFSAGDNARSLTARADEAMYAAKRFGKNRVVAKEQAFVRDLMKK